MPERDHACRVNLNQEVPLQKATQRPCVFGLRFGCDPDSGTMWVRDFCRGTFICDGVRTGVCGQKRLRGKLLPPTTSTDAGSGPLVNCSCSKNESVRHAFRAGFFARAEWMSNHEEAAALRRAGLRRAVLPVNGTAFRGEFILSYLRGATEVKVRPGATVDEMRKTLEQASTQADAIITRHLGQPTEHHDEKG